LASAHKPQGIEEFRKALLEAVNDCLLVIGESLGEALLYHIEKNFGIRRQDIPERLEAFHEAMKLLLDEGATVIDILVTKRLYDRLGLNYERHENWTIVDYVNYAVNAKRGY